MAGGVCVDTSLLQLVLLAPLSLNADENGLLVLVLALSFFLTSI
eukprot:CAMPEP_0196805322 /NCGR_PEP_ID=MMETSP1362-20130617/5101_1 /TAXON_ID=163516 /ORGANISM="Leptocylindrus danicus, Strain CCMP1856" /LENGTH=43 /DNA_ID= /DNA_START= /DNA_END= /DNA_ORIENTATION=